MSSVLQLSAITSLDSLLFVTDDVEAVVDDPSAQ